MESDLFILTCKGPHHKSVGDVWCWQRRPGTSVRRFTARLAQFLDAQGFVGHAVSFQRKSTRTTLSLAAPHIVFQVAPGRLTYSVHVFTLVCNNTLCFTKFSSAQRPEQPWSRSFRASRFPVKNRHMRYAVSKFKLEQENDNSSRALSS